MRSAQEMSERGDVFEPTKPNIEPKARGVKGAAGNCFLVRHALRRLPLYSLKAITAGEGKLLLTCVTRSLRPFSA